MPPPLAAFLKHLRRSRLLSPVEVARMREQLKVMDPRPDSEEFAHQLMKEGKLTRFQADKLLEGIDRGLVLGPYEVLAPLGKGGMARVFLARDRHTRQLLALKLLTPRDVKAKPKLLERLERELHLNRRLDHPCIAEVYDLSLWHKVYLLSLELVPGMDLGHHVRNFGPMPFDHACNVMADVALALDHTHQQGLIHCDVKPGNVMVLPESPKRRGPFTWGKLLDFGLSVDVLRPETNKHVTGTTVFGTMLFAPPEQTRAGKPLTPAADLYTLGGTLYYALAGKPPFKGKNSHERIELQRHGKVPPIESHRPGTPAPLADLIMQMLAKKPEARPPSAAFVADELRNLATITAVASTPASGGR